MWHDNETIVDLLDFQHLVSAVKSIVCNDKLLPCTIGIYGDWGSGKSSLMKMVRKELEKEEGVFCISFNGWLFEGYNDAKSAIMGSILDEIEKNKTLSEKAKGIISKLFSQVDWIHAVGTAAKGAVAFATMGPVGLGITAVPELISLIKNQIGEKAKEVDIEGIIKAVIKPKESKELRGGIREFHDNFANLLNETKIQKLVVFIDDLDRCTPDTIIETLEAIRLFLYTEHTAFIIGADERLVKYAVRRKFPEIPGERVEVGRDYLEKLIQFPIRVPQLSRPEIETYINLLFTNLTISDEKTYDELRIKVMERKSKCLFDVAFNYGIATEMIPDNCSELQDVLILSETISPVLAVGLNGNPRQCKRFLNTLVLRIQMAKSRGIELQYKVLAKLMLLEYFKSEWFRRLAELQAQQEGSPTEISAIEEIIKNNEDADKSLSEEFKIWISDPWMKSWIASEPSLSKIDLRPYFYFARDVLSSLSGSVQRMTPLAQETLTKLLSASEAMRKKALDYAKDVSQADVAAIFESLTDRVRQKENLSGPNIEFDALFQWTKVRAELGPQLISFISKFPEKILPSIVVVKLLDVVSGTPYEDSGLQVLKKWSKSTANETLAKIAGQRLKGRV